MPRTSTSFKPGHKGMGGRPKGPRNGPSNVWRMAAKSARDVGRRADERVIGRVEGRVEPVAGDDGPLVAEQAIHPFLPREPIGVERSPEVEQYCPVVRGQCGARVSRLGGRGRSFVPSPGVPCVRISPYCTTVYLRVNDWERRLIAAIS